MKSPQKKQKNQILFIGYTKLLQNQSRKPDSLKTQYMLIIDLNGAYLYKNPNVLSNNFTNNLSRQKNLNTIQNLQTPQSNFEILPQTQIYLLNHNDPGISQYLLQLKINKQPSQYVCLYCNTRQNIMFPIFFQNKSIAIKFNIAVIIYQLYHKYYPTLQQLRQNTTQKIIMNIKLLQIMATSIVYQDFIINPLNLSSAQIEQFQLQIIKNSIQKFVNKSYYKNNNKILQNNNSNKILQNSNKNQGLFSLHLCYSIVDTLSLSYLPKLISHDILHKNVQQIDISRCNIVDKILQIMLKQQQKNIYDMYNMNMDKNIYQNLIKLDLSGNLLTDACFIPLIGLFMNAPQLSDLCLKNNKIKLQALSALKKQDKHNLRLTKIPSNTRLSTVSEVNMPVSNKIQPYFIQFLLSLQHTPINYLNLDNNLISSPELIVTYIIEGQNVPINYLSLKNNKLSEVDKIRMSKLLINQIKQRGNKQKIPVLQFGNLCIADEQIRQYIIILKQKTSQLNYTYHNQKQTNLLFPQPQSYLQHKKFSTIISGFDHNDLKKIQISQPNIYKISITQNKQWQLCDQQGILQVNNLYTNRRKTTVRKSQIINNILMNSGLSPSNSSSSLKAQSRVIQNNSHEITHDTLKSTVRLLKQSYQCHNYSAIHLYKQLLKQYNLQLYNMKIAPIFIKSQQNLQKQKKQLLKIIDQFINLSLHGYRQEQVNGLLDSIISKLFLKRLEYQVLENIVIGEQDQMEELKGKYSWNVFTFLLYLRYFRDKMIDKYVQKGYNPMLQIEGKFKKQANLYSNYYLLYKQWVCQDNYYILLQKLITKTNNKQNKQNKQNNIIPYTTLVNMQQPATQKQIHELIKQSYLYKYRRTTNLNSCRIPQQKQHIITTQQQFLCIVQPKLMFTGYLIQFYTTRTTGKKPKLQLYNTILTKPTLIKHEQIKAGKLINQGIDNILDYITTYDLFITPCLVINPNIPLSQLNTHQGLKLAIYHPDFQQNLTKFSQLVIAFIKFLYHSPQTILPQTLQYLNYLINIILSQPNQFNSQCLSTQFYIQLLAYNANHSSQLRSKQINTLILTTLIQYCSYYMKYHIMLQPYIIAHVLRSQINSKKFKDKSICKLIKTTQNKYNKKDQQLSQGIVSYIFQNINNNNNKYGLDVLVEIYFNDLFVEIQDYLGMQKIVLQVHILTAINQLLGMIQNTGITKKWDIMADMPINQNSIVRRNKNWALFVYNLQTHKQTLLLPPTNQTQTIYSLFHKQILSPPKSTPKYRLTVKPLYLPLLSPIHNFTNQQQINWWYGRIYYGFSQYGTYLTMLQSYSQHFNISSLTVKSILCDILLTKKQQIQQLTLQNPSKWQQKIRTISQQYIQRLHQYCPKGTTISLSSQQKQYIETQLNKQLYKLLINLNKVTKYYSQILQNNIYQFQYRCRLITGCTLITDSITQQQLLFTTYGLIQINKTIYVQALYWQYVYDIVINYSQQGQLLKQIQIRYIQISTNNQTKHKQQTKKLLKILCNKHAQSQIFGNVVLLMIRNLGILAITNRVQVLYKHISYDGLVADRKIEQNRNGNGEQGDYGKFKNIWEEICQYLQYIKQQDNKQNKEDKYDKDDRDNKYSKYDKHDKNDKNDKQNIHDNDDIHNIYNQKISPKIPTNQQIHLPTQNNKIEPKFPTQQTPIPVIPQQQPHQPIQAPPKISSHNEPDITITHIVQNIKKQQQPKQQQIVVTNARRSSRRQLPKRRSSRQK